VAAAFIAASTLFFPPFNPVLRHFDTAIVARYTYAMAFFDKLNRLPAYAVEE
jgi:hypothetical protein